MAFVIPEDIANRALQHCGATRITSFSDDSKNASETAACYDGLRMAELRRNVWRFAVRRAVLYPINGAVTGLTAPTTDISSNQTLTASLPTMGLVPGSWSATGVYNFGAIISYGGRIWVSTVPANVAMRPGTDSNVAWDTYFGSMCVSPYDSTRNYFAGDLVYEDNSSGQIDVFASLENNNDNDPSDGTPWSATTTYSEGAVVEDTQGFFWRSAISLNTNNQPGVYGQWDNGATYTIGEYAIGSDYNLYLSNGASTGLDPLTHPVFWTLIGTPGSWPQWQTGTHYSISDVVVASDGMLYRAITGSNSVDPTTAVFDPLSATNRWQPLGIACPWIAQFSGSTGAAQWLRLDATVTPLNINYPLGSGPSTQTDTRNIFQLPNGYLRQAPKDPKAGSNSFLGAPSGLQYDDWVFEGNYIVSRQSYPMIFRFVADITQVTKMDEMFCEGLACRIGAEVCETLTQSGSKLANIASMYKVAMGDARTVNGIEEGPVEPPEDDYLTCRI